MSLFLRGLVKKVKCAFDPSKELVNYILEKNSLNKNDRRCKIQQQYGAVQRLVIICL